jgi:hypothetical protein
VSLSDFFFFFKFLAAFFLPLKREIKDAYLALALTQWLHCSMEQPMTLILKAWVTILSGSPTQGDQGISLCQVLTQGLDLRIKETTAPGPQVMVETGGHGGGCSRKDP